MSNPVIPPEAPAMRLPPPLRRSITLWTGLLLILCGCWAWWRSCSVDAGVWWGDCGVASTQRAIEIYCTPHPSHHSHPGFRYASWSIDPANPNYQHEKFPLPFLVRAVVLPATTDGDFIPTADHLVPQGSPGRYRLAAQYMTSQGGPGSWTLYLPYWLLLLCFIPAWAGLLVWQRRRIRKLHRSGGIPPI